MNSHPYLYAFIAQVYTICLLGTILKIAWKLPQLLDT